jgi:cytosine/creatinine deaminase
LTAYQVTPAAIVATMTPSATHANALKRVNTKAIQQPRPMRPSAGCMNSSRGCSPGRAVIRVWVIGGTFAPAAYASAAAAGTPIGAAGTPVEDTAGAAAVAAAECGAPPDAATGAETGASPGTSAASGAASPEPRAGCRAARRDTPAAAVKIQSSMAAISNGPPFVSTLPAAGIALPAMSFGQANAVDAEMMDLALGQARASLADGGVPVGAVLAEGGQVIAAGHNERVQRGDPVAHGEISALRNAGRRATYAGTTMYTTLSPCPMCTGAILLFQIPRVVVGEAETFPGDLTFLSGQGVEVVLLNDDRCEAVMREFQQRYPEIWSEDIGGR